MKYETFQKRFAKRVVELRKQKGITQESMEDHVEGLSYRTMQQIEQCRTSPNLRTLFALAQGLGIKVRDLLDEIED